MRPAKDLLTSITDVLCRGRPSNSIDLSEFDVSSIRSAYFDTLSMSLGAADFILDQIRKGKIDGRSYEGECCCVLGKIAQHDKVSWKQGPIKADPLNSIVERFTQAIRPGDKPANSRFCKALETWTVEWIEHRDAYRNRSKVEW